MQTRIFFIEYAMKNKLVKKYNNINIFYYFGMFIDT